ncbi:MAG: DUF4832 domain-containing protein [Lachnospiraceae bacterium]|nr:DUF4832 domain-containing protein [Lachnospiraceae bacterium]
MGEARDRAIEFSKKLGYDLRIKEATFIETVNEKNFDLDLVMENIGVAPFYYNAAKWPVLIGFKNSEGLVASFKTDWDLSSVPADGSAVSFSYSLKDHKLGAGDYEVCVKVSNPLKGGRFITFANEGGKEDGWLSLGGIHVNGEEKELKVIEEVLPIVYSEPEPIPDGIDGVYQAENGTIEGQAIIDKSVPECQGGRKVGYIGKEGGSLTFENVEVEKDGIYSVEITYITKEDRFAKVSVNGGEDIKVEFPPTGEDWTTLGSIVVEFELKVGANTLRFHNEAGWAPDLDCIKILN